MNDSSFSYKIGISSKLALSEGCTFYVPFTIILQVELMRKYIIFISIQGYYVDSRIIIWSTPDFSFPCSKFTNLEHSRFYFSLPHFINLEYTRFWNFQRKILILQYSILKLPKCFFHWKKWNLEYSRFSYFQWKK